MQELKTKLSQYSKVIALKGSDYEGLTGTIETILEGSERETENDCQLDIIVIFQEPEYTTIEDSHPHLNGTSIEDVIMGEHELGFFIDGNWTIVDFKGRLVCTSCYSPLELVTETQYDDINWSFDEMTGKYIKDCSGGSEGKKCPLCGGDMSEIEENILPY